MDGLRQDLRFALRTLAGSSTHSHSASLAELSHPMFLEMRDKADVFAGVLRQHQPLHHPLARGVPQRAAPSWRTAFQWLL